MIHVFPRWFFGYLLQAKPKHTAAGHEVICGTLSSINSRYGTLHCSPLFRYRHFCLVITDPLDLVLKQNIR